MGILNVSKVRLMSSIKYVCLLLTLLIFGCVPLFEKYIPERSLGENLAFLKKNLDGRIDINGVQGETYIRETSFDFSTEAKSISVKEQTEIKIFKKYGRRKKRGSHTIENAFSFNLGDIDEIKIIQGGDTGWKKPYYHIKFIDNDLHRSYLLKLPSSNPSYWQRIQQAFDEAIWHAKQSEN